MGSPPRMRGKGRERQGQGRKEGITPAYAGKSVQASLHTTLLRDHPRVCGEKTHKDMTTEDNLGSPPRMRGKVCCGAVRLPVVGITPAYAGKSVFSCISCSASAGSPPRMRGKACSACFHLRNLGITPAYAGKSRRVVARLLAAGDHPRVCGEKLCPTWPHAPNAGSPPRMRGKAIDRHFSEPRFGITPAYAGKSGTWGVTSPDSRDHPRMCGEKLYTPCMIAPKVGSPPHVRGKAVSYGNAALLFGITPACAGKSRPITWATSWRRDHPRMCGEKSTAFLQLLP